MAKKKKILGLIPVALIIGILLGLLSFALYDFLTNNINNMRESLGIFDENLQNILLIISIILILIFVFGVSKNKITKEFSG